VLLSFCGAFCRARGEPGVDAREQSALRGVRRAAGADGRPGQVGERVVVETVDVPVSYWSTSRDRNSRGSSAPSATVAPAATREGSGTSPRPS
jgi:hypothetical protein